jgi:hypothetical protein
MAGRVEFRLWLFDIELSGKMKGKGVKEGYCI